MNNARPHASKLTHGFFLLIDSGVQLIKQSPYLDLCDRWIFRIMKSKLNGVDLTNQEDFVVRQLWKTRDHAKRVIERGGHYLPLHWLIFYVSLFIGRPSILFSREWVACVHLSTQLKFHHVYTIFRGEQEMNNFIITSKSILYKCLQCDM